MRTVYNMNLLNTECPATMTEQKCPLRKYLNSPASALRISINETLLMPKTSNVEDLVKTINQMNQICHECQTNNVNQR
ncbi:MAG: hypothetical protein IKP24_01650 [Alphaproteobacteria bacterium]|nr:hypothetical protein [Alphaproteobacteria bacterium]